MDTDDIVRSEKKFTREMSLWVCVACNVANEKTGEVQLAPPNPPWIDVGAVPSGRGTPSDCGVEGPGGMDLDAFGEAGDAVAVVLPLPQVGAYEAAVRGRMGQKRGLRRKHSRPRILPMPLWWQRRKV